MENVTLKLNKGDNAPDFKLQQADGQELSLSDALKEGSSILLLFCHGMGCEVCVRQLKEYEDNLGRFEDRGIRPLIITSRSKEDNEKFKKEVGLSIPVLSDDATVADRYGAIENDRLKPTMMLVDRHGMLDWIYVGECEPNSDWPTMEYIFRHMVMAKGV
jgi:peroxiredoxin